MKITTPQFFLLTILFFSISQLGKHFWPYTAYVSGIRVDYLSPTLYFSDILVSLLFIYSIPQLIGKLVQYRKVPLILLVTVLLLCISVLVAKYVSPALYGAVKLIEMIFLGYMASRHISHKNAYLVACVMAVAVCVESLIMLLQVFNQGSIGGILYFLGERTFSIGNIGIASVTIFGTEVLRAYGTFPHPNVGAFFMLFGITLSIYGLANTTKNKRVVRYLFYTSLCLAILSILLSFSRVGYLGLLGVLLYCSYSFPKYKKFLRVLVGVSVCIGLILFQRFGISTFFSSDLLWRIDLASIAFKIIAEHSIFGVGLLNYFYYQIDYQRTLTPVLLQPPHSVYLLVLLQLGIVGTVVVGYLLYKTISRCLFYIRQKPSSFTAIVSVLIFVLLGIGFVDHYPVTLQQGMILTTYILGIVWTSESSKESE